MIGWAVRAAKGEQVIRRKFDYFFGFLDPALTGLWSGVLATIWPWTAYTYRPFKFWHRLKHLIIEWARLDVNRSTKFFLDVIIMMALGWIFL